MGEIVNIVVMFKRIREILWSKLATPERYARHIGVTIGSDCLIDTRQWSSEPYLVSIGSHVQLTHGVSIHTHGGANAIRWKDPDFDVFGKVRIEDWAYIGSYAQIMPGITIGEGAIVAAGSIVTKSVKPHTVVAGNPARFVCTTEEYYNKNLPYNLRTKGLSLTEKKEKLMNLDDSLFIKK